MIERISREILTLPVNQYLKDRDISKISKFNKNFYKKVNELNKIAMKILCLIPARKNSNRVKTRILLKLMVSR